MLATLTDVKNYLGISGDTMDARLTLMIKKISSQIEELIGCSLARGNYTDELHAVNNRQLIQLNHFPIQSVSKVTENGQEVTDYKLIPNYSVNGLLYRGAGWVGGFYTRGMDYDPVAGEYSIKVDYTAGYYLPDDENYSEGAEDSLPYAITAACLEACAEEYNVVMSGANGVKSHSEGGISTSFTAGEASGIGEAGLSVKVQSMLKDFQRVGVA